MKNLIILNLLVFMCVFAGCDDGEVIEILSAQEAESNNIETDIDGNYEKETGNIEINDSQSFVVYVTGQVKNPGVYEFPEESRIINAIDAAGGYTDEACETYLNLASALSDGQMIYVPSMDEVYSNDSDAAQGMLIAQSGGSISGTENQLININTASKEELMTLPGIGESKAEKIISYREQNGRFSSAEGIMEISGIKDGLYNKIKDRICAK